MPQLTMADIKRRAKAAGSHYFDKGTKAAFGVDRFFGPYSGKGGTFFVQQNKTGWSIKRFGEDDRIHPVAYDGIVHGPGALGAGIRVAAQRMAVPTMGGAAARKA